MYTMNVKSRLRAAALAGVVVAGSVAATACTQRHVAGGLIGGAAVGGAYEYQNKKAIRALERDLHAGRISVREYKHRREAIEERSLIY